MVFSKSLDEIGEGYVCKYMLYIFNTPITTFKERQRKQRDDTKSVRVRVIVFNTTFNNISVIS
jgi:hypothetical protein